MQQVGIAGTLESSDIMITIEKQNLPEISISLQSNVEKQFGQQIRQVIEETLKKIGITSAKITAIDNGALDCTIQARTIVAAYRGAQKTIDWEEIDSWIN